MTDQSALFFALFALFVSILSLLGQLFLARKRRQYRNEDMIFQIEQFECSDAFAQSLDWAKSLEEGPFKEGVLIGLKNAARDLEKNDA